MQAELKAIERILFAGVLATTISACGNLFFSASSYAATKAPNGEWQYVPQTTNSQALAQFNGGMRLFQLADMKSAVVRFDNAIAIDPRCAEFYFKRGEAYLELDKLKEAISDLNRTIVLEPDHYPAYKRLARAEYERGNIDAAIKASESAIKHCSFAFDKADSYKTLGKLHSFQKKYDLAIQDMTESLALDKSAHTFLLRGSQYFAVHQYQKAVDDYTAALNQHNDKFYDRLYSLRADAYEKLGRHDLAKADRKKSKDLVDDSWGGVLKDMDKQTKL